MWSVVLSISDISTVLIILGGLQISAVIVALLVLMLPMLLVNTEPRLRMLKWSEQRSAAPHHSTAPPLPVLSSHRPVPSAVLWLCR